MKTYPKPPTIDREHINRDLVRRRWQELLLGASMLALGIALTLWVTAGGDGPWVWALVGSFAATIAGIYVSWIVTSEAAARAERDRVEQTSRMLRQLLETHNTLARRPESPTDGALDALLRGDALDALLHGVTLAVSELDDVMGRRSSLVNHEAVLHEVLTKIEIGEFWRVYGGRIVVSEQRRDGTLVDEAAPRNEAPDHQSSGHGRTTSREGNVRDRPPHDDPETAEDPDDRATAGSES